MFVDMALDRAQVAIRDDFHLLGIAALFLAHKMDEVEPRRVQEFSFHTQGRFEPRQIAQKEKWIVQLLRFQLLPDTLYFWVDLLMTLWDEYACQHLTNSKLFKRNDVSDPLQDDERRLYQFPGPYLF